MHLRPPSTAHGVTSLIWAVFFFLLIWIGGSFVGINGAITFIVGAAAGFLSFIAIVKYGRDDPRRS